MTSTPLLPGNGKFREKLILQHLEKPYNHKNILAASSVIFIHISWENKNKSTCSHRQMIKNKTPTKQKILNLEYFDSTARSFYLPLLNTQQRLKFFITFTGKDNQLKQVFRGYRALS